MRKKTQMVYLAELPYIDVSTQCYKTALATAKKADDEERNLEECLQGLFNSYKKEVASELASGQSEYEAVISTLLRHASYIDSLNDRKARLPQVLNSARAARAELQEMSEKWRK